METHTFGSTRLFDIARMEAQRCQHAYIRSEHLLLALLHDPLIVEQSGIQIETIRQTLETMPVPRCGVDQKLILSVTAQRIVDNLPEAGDHTTALKWLKAIIEKSPTARTLLSHAGFDPVAILERIKLGNIGNS
jgi:ATP-dependent Clp protease ATP-binding subunit ClpA